MIAVVVIVLVVVMVSPCLSMADNSKTDVEEEREEERGKDVDEPHCSADTYSVDDCLVAADNMDTTSNDGLGDEPNPLFMNGSGVPQNVGRPGELPDSIRSQIKQTVCHMNEYFVNKVMPRQLSSKLIGDTECQNQQGLCAFWAWQERCNDKEYDAYMTTECPLACRQCDVVRGQAFLQYLHVDLSDHYHKNNNDNDSKVQETPNHETNGDQTAIITTRRRMLHKVMQDVGMDPNLIGARPLQENWYYTLHDRLMKAIPEALLRTYPTVDSGSDTDDDPSIPFKDTDSNNQELLSRHVETVERIHNVRLAQDQQLPGQSSSHLFLPYRHRGHCVVSMTSWDEYVSRSLQLNIGYAIPSPAAIEAIVSLQKPVLQMGAGTGYWSALLKTKGVDLVAYDAAPPHLVGSINDSDNGKNDYFDVWYDDTVRPGTCQSVLMNAHHHQQQQQQRHNNKADTNNEDGSNSTVPFSEHALFLMWPNDPDPVDNPEFHDHTESPPIWDSACLEAFHAIGGKTVVYVGEREAALSGPGPDSGLSSTRAFQRMLQEKYELMQTVALPHLWMNEDDLTIWERR